MYIYEIRNIKDNKVYIGQTRRAPVVRWNEHKIALNKNKHSNGKLQFAWNKYGENFFVFNVIQNCTTIDELNALEEYFVKQAVNGYNLKGGGNSRVWSSESRKKLSLSKKGKPNGQRGMKKTPMAYNLKVKRSKITRPAGYPDIVDSMGIVYKVESVREFAKQHNLWFSGLASLFGKTNACFHYKGWRLATSTTIGVPFVYTAYNKALHISKSRRPNGFPKLISPNGNVLEIMGTLTEFCDMHGLNAGNVSCLINGKKDTYKGWKLYIPMEN